MASFDDLVEEWSRTALESGWPERWVEGAIFPREMVAFLAWCDHLGIVDVVESGRQDGYSTMILGEFADRRDGSVVSIDLELDPDRADRCRQRLAAFQRLELMRGEAFLDLGRIVAGRGPRTLAVLIDGPKSFHGLALLLAAASFPHVTLLAQHNINPGSAEHHYIAGRTRSSPYLEQHVRQTGAAWQELTRRERQIGEAFAAARPLDHSTLAIVPVEGCRLRLHRSWNVRHVFLQPPIVAMVWRLRWWRALVEIYRVSFWLERRLRRCTFP